MADGSDISSLSRKDLYEKIWEMPATKLAELYSIDYAAILALCDSRQVPRPPPGYWSKVRHGVEIKRTPLLAESSAIANSKIRRAEPRPLKKKLYKKTVPIAPSQDESVKPSHPLVVKTYRAFKEIRPDHTDRLKPKEAALNVYVGYRNLDRAMRVVERIIRELERLGHAVRVEKDSSSGRWRTQAVIQGEPVNFHLEESVTKRPLPPDRKSAWPSPNYEYETTGKLKLLIDDYLGDWQRKSWGDAKRSRIEEKIPSIIESLLQAGENLRKRKEERERQEAEWRTKEMQRREEERQAIEQRKETEKLDSQALAWDKAERIRRFVTAFKSALEGKVGAPEAERMAGEWMRSSLSHADAIDPILLNLKQFESTNGPARI